MFFIEGNPSLIVRFERPGAFWRAQALDGFGCIVGVRRSGIVCVACRRCACGERLVEMAYAEQSPFKAC